MSKNFFIVGSDRTLGTKNEKRLMDEHKLQQERKSPVKPNLQGCTLRKGISVAGFQEIRRLHLPLIEVIE